MKTNPTIKKSKLIEWRNALVFAVVVATLFRWSLAEAYVIPTGSMENSVLVGDYILVSKVHYGSRTPQTPLQVPLTHQKIWGTEIPSYLDWVQIPSFRFPGLREVERGEIVVFNTPKDLLDPTDRPNDLMTLLVKRCVAVSGDVLEIRDRKISVNGKEMTDPSGMKIQYEVITNYPLQPHQVENLGLGKEDYWISGYSEENKSVYGMLLTPVQMNAIQKARDVVSVQASAGSPVGFPLFPEIKNDSWDLNNYGPLTVPQRGMTIQVDEMTLSFYGEVIEKYEGNEQVNFTGGQLEIDGKKVETYTFNQDYFFMMGDSRDNSIDSRYWGFVPESHIIGKPIMVLFSKNVDGEGLDKVRWERIFSRIE